MDVVYFQPEDDHETRIAESETFWKQLQVQTWVENNSSFQFSTLNRGGWKLGENGGVSSHTEQLQEKI